MSLKRKLVGARVKLPESPWLGYGVAAAGIPVAAWLRHELTEMLGEGVPPYITFYPVVVLSSFLGGTAVGVGTTLVSAAIVAYVFLAPVSGILFDRPGDMAGLALFIGINLLLSVMGGAIRRTHRKAVAHAQQLSRGVERLNAEISERERNAAALRESEERLRTLVELSSQVMWVSSPRGEPVGDSASWRKFTGRTREQWMGWNWLEAIHPDERQRVAAHWRSALESGQPYRDEYQLLHANGEYREVRAAAAPIQGSAGEVREWIGMLTDITATKRAETARNVLAAIVAETGDAVIATTRTGHITSWNLGAERILGYTADQVVGRTMQQLKVAESASDQMLFIGPIERGLQTVSFESQWRTAQGRRVEVSVTASAIRNRTGALSGISLIARDITDRKHAEEALRTSERRYRSLFDAIDEGFCVIRMFFDSDGAPVDWQFLEANPGFAKQSGRSDAVGLRYREICTAPETPWLEILGNVVRTGQPVRQIAFSEAFRRWLDFYAFPTGEPAEQKVAVLFTDVTARRAAEEALQQARSDLSRLNVELEGLVHDRTAELEATVGELEQFSYTITHDMRAPLRAMQGFCAILLEECGGRFDPEHRNYLDRIAAAAQRMDRLITDALQYSRVVRQELPLEVIDTGDLLRDIIDSYPQFQSPRAEIHLDPDLPRVLGNAAALTQCFSNYLSNAVKFVKAGTSPAIFVSAGNGVVRSESAEGHEMIRLSFRDNGVGIEPRYYDKIWTMFHQLDPAYEGTGVGLALVRAAAAKMGGRVGVNSEPGQGSTFWIELRRAKPSDAGSAPAPSPAPS